MFMRIIARRGAAFAKEQDGAVTVDWVVLTAAVVGLALVAMNGINGSTGNVASGVGGYLSGVSVE